MPLLFASILNWVLIGIGLTLFLMMMATALISRLENERRAAGIALALAFILPLPYLMTGLGWATLWTVVLIAVPTGVLLMYLIPHGRPALVDDTPRTRIDERDIMFSRRLLQPGTDRFTTYYECHPDKKILDDQFRAQPGLLSPDAIHAHPLAFAAANASFDTVEAFHPMLERRTTLAQPVAVDPEAATRFIKHWARKLGAVSVGITRLRDYHLYSHIGRGAAYGQPVTLDHTFAIAVTVEMDKATLDHAPLSPTVMESAQQYLNAGAIAVQLSECIQNLGYPARAHIDGNYRVVCPLVARDAGLGEIGRMGLMMTPELGPRVRIAVVTTDLPLIADQRQPDPTMHDFCLKCRKCADICPSQAISFDPPTEIEGVQRWQIDSEACFTFWCTVGTDCARCVRVCPYSHPDNLLHNLVRFGLKRSATFRRAAVVMDDVFYGRKPVPEPLPSWLVMKK